MKHALVTGGNRGIGLEIAKGLVQNGHHVWLGSRDMTAGQEVANQIGAHAIALDVSDHTSIEKAVQQTGPVDILVNNAGVLHYGNLLEDVAAYEDTMAVMVRGPYLLMHHYVPHMIRRGYGRIVNLTSGWGAFSEGMEGPGAYGMAKASLNALTYAAAKTLPDNVKVNAMCPGWVRTRMGGEEADRSPEEGADTAIWLAELEANGPSGGFFRDRQAIDW